ncbi:hypothetical protein GDO81_014796 [Engystomops pustulosus]|uniref:Uncharacterized protein n=1 Tax=Engystomops pustulosus TaxID=76066 RepID=A0AAV7AEZ4_ENGPU|nr:hypothetical protein GDO81_014796 [Engystomops pustulosus]
MQTARINTTFQSSFYTFIGSLQSARVQSLHSEKQRLSDSGLYCFGLHPCREVLSFREVCGHILYPDTPGDSGCTSSVRP